MVEVNLDLRLGAEGSCRREIIVAIQIEVGQDCRVEPPSLEALQHVLLPDAEEDEVECAAAEELDAFARRLGATARETARLVELYVSDGRDDLPDEYVSSCDGRFG